MKIKISHDEWRVVLGCLRIALEIEQGLRDNGTAWFHCLDSEEEETIDLLPVVEDLHSRAENLPTRSKAGMKAQLTKSGMDKETQKEEFPLLFEENTVPEYMRMKIEKGREYPAIESTLCLNYELFVRGNVYVKTKIRKITGVEPEVLAGKRLNNFGQEILDELIERVMLLERKSQAGKKALVTRHDLDVDIEDGTDYRGEEHHKKASEAFKEISEI